MRVMILSATLAALAACSTEKRLLAPDHEAEMIVSPKKPDNVQGRGVDPVCGARLDHAEVSWHSSHDGEEMYFESEACKRQFDANPDLYRTTAR